jgi:hypothetical protein
MQHERKHKAWSLTCSIDMDKRHGNGNVAWTWTCIMEIEMVVQHGLDLQYGHGVQHGLDTQYGFGHAT